MAFSQVNGHMEVQGGAYCKTVGLSLRWFEPNTCHHQRNGPHAAETRPGGPFPSCYAM